MVEQKCILEYPFSAEWNFDKNGKLRPEKVTAGSGKKVWWKCSKCGYEWEAIVVNRRNGSGCPACVGRVIVKNVNDLATINPALLSEWHFEKNGKLRPENVKAGSHEKVWWKCSKCGHEWEARIGSRCRGRGCPACAGRVVVAGKNDLATAYPQLAKEWDYEKNGDLKPTDVTTGSSREVWWKCERGHVWSARVSSRVYGSGCLLCRRKRLV